MRNQNENQNNASVTLKELELPKGAIITINGVSISWDILYKLDCLGQEEDLESIKSILARACMDIASESDEGNMPIVDNSFYCYIKLFYNLLDSLRETMIELNTNNQERSKA